MSNATQLSTLLEPWKGISSTPTWKCEATSQGNHQPKNSLFWESSVYAEHRTPSHLPSRAPRICFPTRRRSPRRPPSSAKRPRRPKRGVIPARGTTSFVHNGVRGDGHRRPANHFCPMDASTSMASRRLRLADDAPFAIPAIGPSGSSRRQLLAACNVAHPTRWASTSSSTPGNMPRWACRPKR